jgi:hypothetical protein
VVTVVTVLAFVAFVAFVALSAFCTVVAPIAVTMSLAEALANNPLPSPFKIEVPDVWV